MVCVEEETLQPTESTPVLLESNLALQDAFRRIDHLSFVDQRVSGYDDAGYDPYSDEVYVDCPYEDSKND